VAAVLPSERRAADAAAPPPDPRAAPRRFARLDALRGAAMIWMAAFHLGFDLHQFGHWRQDFYADPFWTVQRTAIVTLFLLCAGAGQAIAARRGQPPAAFWRRWAQIVACALAVSAASYVMFPRSFISFGVLHGIAVMLLLSRLAARLDGRWLWPLGLLAIALPQLVSHPFFDSRATDWIGLVTRKPVTEDYVPVLPWLGVMLWGQAAGAWALRRRPGWLHGALPAALAPLAALGRWPLTFYMLHQPLLIGALTAWQRAGG